MNRRTVLGILGSFVSLSRLLQAQAASEEKVHTADELKALLDKEGKNLFVLDVREPKELEELGMLKGSFNVPVGEVEKRMAEIPKGKPLVVVCARGRRAARAAETLRKNGYEVKALGGLLEWKEKNYPLVYPKAEAKKDNSEQKKQ
jgi:rhodanese-related sulfurtransferase